MIKYALPVYLPVCLDRIFVAPLLLLRRVWYDYTFRRIKLANSDEYAIVDPSDFAELSKYVWWADCKHGNIRVIRFKGRLRGHTALQMTRQIMKDELDTQPPALRAKLAVDHINRNTLDNRRANLRLATNIQNARNRAKNKKACSSIYKGVHWNKHHKKWGCQINHRGKSIHLGYFDDEIKAAKCYDAAAKKYHGEFACLNFPPPNKKGLKNLIKYWFSHFRSYFSPR